jgi:hypothetical protein
MAATRRRTAVLGRLAERVVEGQLMLFEAAERFRDINETSPDFSWVIFRGAFPDGTDDERFCRFVITMAQIHYAGDECRARAVAARLEAQLAAELRRGTLRLPQ